MPGTSFLADLRSVLAERNFRRLFATRLISQAGDGMFTAGLGAYVFFNQQTFPNPSAAAAAFAVLYLPYSLIGPFAGVFIDRWSRRQILVWSALLRAAVVTFTASLVAVGSLGAPLYVSVLGVLGVNRFFLASLSAALPHVVADDKLVMANSVAPTTGTVVAFLGGLTGLGVHLATGAGAGGSAATLIAAGGCYLCAGSVGATMRRDLLGPPRLGRGEQRAGLARELVLVIQGLASGARHVWRRRAATAVLAATASHRAMYGILLLASILLYRNYFYITSGANSSLAHFTLVVVASALGYGAAALVTPVVTRRLSKQAWIALLLLGGGVVAGALGPTFRPLSFLAIGLALGVVAQGVAICAITILQQQVDDSYRGRVFALYDMLFNIPFVIGAAAAAQVIPASGKSFLLILVAALGYLAAALAYAGASRQELRLEPSPAVPGGPGTDRPASPAVPSRPGSARPPSAAASSETADPPGAASPSAAPHRRSS
ncbi:MAG TPA: MFS transporter [Streptosporangiaceae bacterium]